jgi:hypothetical protein
MSVPDNEQIDLEAGTAVAGNDHSNPDVTTDQNIKTYPWMEEVIRSKKHDPQ